MSISLVEYIALVTSEHRDRPKYIASLSAALEQVLAASTLLEAVNEAFDIDTAVGQQLDIIGEWVGRSRYIGVPLPNVYFTWGGTAALGWGSGVWKGQFDPVSGLASLGDEDYRILLKAKIAANHWDGTVPGAYEVWANIFDSDIELLIQDNQNMTMTVGIVGPPLSAVTKALLTGGYIPLKPAGVRVNYKVSPDGGPLFAWGISNGTTLAGWATGRWGETL